MRYIGRSRNGWRIGLVAAAFTAVACGTAGAQANQSVQPAPHKTPAVMKGGVIPAGGLQPSNRQPGGAKPAHAANSAEADRARPELPGCNKMSRDVPSKRCGNTAKKVTAH